jgi:hypothetical protein
MSSTHGKCLWHLAVTWSNLVLDSVDSVIITYVLLLFLCSMLVAHGPPLASWSFSSSLLVCHCFRSIACRLHIYKPRDILHNIRTTLRHLQLAICITKQMRTRTQLEKPQTSHTFASIVHHKWMRPNLVSQFTIVQSINQNLLNSSIRIFSLNYVETIFVDTFYISVAWKFSPIQDLFNILDIFGTQCCPCMLQIRCSCMLQICSLL